MCKCICVPKMSGNNTKCDSCHPGRPKGKGHDPRRPSEIKAKRGKGKRIGVILAQLGLSEDPQAAGPA
jgi:hypothetical protein